MDKYVFETDDNKEMNIVTNRYKLIMTLNELSNWRRELYKGYDNKIKYFCNGKLYNEMELYEDESVPRDEHRLITDCHDIYMVDDIIDKIDDILYDVRDILNNY